MTRLPSCTAKCGYCLSFYELRHVNYLRSKLYNKYVPTTWSVALACWTWTCSSCLCFPSTEMTTSISNISINDHFVGSIHTHVEKKKITRGMRRDPKSSQRVLPEVKFFFFLTLIACWICRLGFEFCRFLTRVLLMFDTNPGPSLL